MRSRRIAFFAALCTLCLLAAACGGSDESTDDAVTNAESNLLANAIKANCDFADLAQPVSFDDEVFIEQGVMPEINSTTWLLLDEPGTYAVGATGAAVRVFSTSDTSQRMVAWRDDVPMDEVGFGDVYASSCGIRSRVVPSDQSPQTNPDSIAGSNPDSIGGSLPGTAGTSSPGGCLNPLLVQLRGSGDFTLRIEHYRGLTPETAIVLRADNPNFEVPVPAMAGDGQRLTWFETAHHAPVRGVQTIVYTLDASVAGVNPENLPQLELYDRADLAKTDPLLALGVGAPRLVRKTRLTISPED